VPHYTPPVYTEAPGGGSRLGKAIESEATGRGSTPPLVDDGRRSASLARRWTIALYVALVVLMSWTMWSWTYDDGYITYTFARNLAEGRGLTWNGEPVLGTSSPGLAVLLAGLTRMAPLPIPQLASLLTAFFALALALASRALGEREGLPFAGAIAGVLWIAHPLLWQFKGSEVAMGVACVVVSAWAWQGGRHVLAGTLLALTVALRTELGLVAPLLAMAAVSQHGFRAGARGALKVAVIPAAAFLAWLLAIWTVAGAALPRTLAAKRAQADSPFEFWQGGWSFVREAIRDYDALLDGRGIWWAALALAGAMWFVASRRFRRAPFVTALALWGPLHLVLDVGLEIPYYGWYTFPGLLTLVLLCSLALGAGLRHAGRGRALLRPFTAAVSILLLAGLWVGAPRVLALRMPDARNVVHCGVAQLADRHPPGTSLAAFEVGYLGYHLRRASVLDILGLVTLQAPLDAVRSGRFEETRHTLAPDLLMLKTQAESLTRPLVGDASRFHAEYRLERLQTAVIPMMVYRRNALPPRGEVIHDLLPALVEQGASVEVVGVGGHALPALRLQQGERRAVEIEPQPQPAKPYLFVAFAGDAGAAHGRIQAGPASAPEPVAKLQATAGSWNAWRERIDLSAGGRFELQCSKHSASPCLFGLPHLTRVDPANPDLLAPGACEGFPLRLLATKEQWLPPPGLRSVETVALAAVP
jgi:hypothetical protein